MPPCRITTTIGRRSTRTSRRTRPSSNGQRPWPGRPSAGKKSHPPMPKAVRFHRAESVDPRVAVGLRRLGVDVTTSHEVGLLHASDGEQMAYLLRERRVILTQDADFLRMAAAGVGHPGILFYQDQRRTI